MRLRRKAGGLDILEIQEELLALQADHSVHLPGETRVLLVNSAAVAVALRLKGVASLGAAVVGAAGAVAEGLGSLGQKKGTYWSLFLFFRI